MRMWEYAVHVDYEHIREYADGDENLIHVFSDLLHIGSKFGHQN